MHPNLMTAGSLLFAVAGIALTVWAVYTGANRSRRLVLGVLIGVTLLVAYWNPLWVYWVMDTFGSSWVYYPAIFAATGGVIGLYVGLAPGGMAWLVWRWRGGSFVACMIAGTLAGLAGYLGLSLIPGTATGPGIPTWLFFTGGLLFAFIAALVAGCLTTRRPQVAPA